MNEKINEQKILWKDRHRHLGLPLSFTKYYIDEDRLYLQKGFFKTEIEEILLYRIMDIKSTRTFGQKLLGVGTVCLYSADQTNKTLELVNVKKARKVHRFISEIVEKERIKRGIAGREMIGTAGAILHGHHHPDDIVDENHDGVCDYEQEVSFDEFN